MALESMINNSITKIAIGLGFVALEYTGYSSIGVESA